MESERRSDRKAAEDRREAAEKSSRDALARQQERFEAQLAEVRTAADRRVEALELSHQNEVRYAQGRHESEVERLRDRIEVVAANGEARLEAQTRQSEIDKDRIKADAERNTSTHLPESVRELVELRKAEHLWPERTWLDDLQTVAPLLEGAISRLFSGGGGGAAAQPQLPPGSDDDDDEIITTGATSYPDDDDDEIITT